VERQNRDILNFAARGGPARFSLHSYSMTEQGNEKVSETIRGAAGLFFVAWLFT
jgi:hypothetical protein